MSGTALMSETARLHRTRRSQQCIPHRLDTSLPIATRAGDTGDPRSCGKKNTHVTDQRPKINRVIRETGMRLTDMGGARSSGGLRAGRSGLVLLLWLLLAVVPARAAEAPAAPPPAM